MSKNRYVYASARIRVLEDRLLSEEDFRQLDAVSFRQCLQFLDGRGWHMEKGETDGEGMLRREEEKTRQVFWSMGEVREDFRILELPGILQNLKAAVKADACGIGQEETEGTGLRLQDLFPEVSAGRAGEYLTAVKTGDYGQIPSGMGAAARQSREILRGQGNGQECECILDRAALEEMLREGERSGISAVRRYARMTAEHADIQIVLRGEAAGWSRDCIRRALVRAGKLDPEQMARAAEAGSHKLDAYLEKAGFGQAAEAFRKSPAMLENWQWERERHLIRQARQDDFSGGLILAYFLERRREIREVREILARKRKETARK